MSDCKSNAKFATRNCRRLEETRRGCAITCTRWGVSTRCGGGRVAAAAACRAANTPPSTCRMNAANGMRRYTRIPATSRHAALMKSDIRILTGLSHSISGFGKNSILTSLVEALGVIYKIAVCLFTFIVLLLPTSFSCVITVFEIDTGT